MKNLTIISAIILVSLFACKDDDVENPPKTNEEELITTFIINFKDKANIQADASASFVDLDGDGGNNPTQFDTIVLKSSTNYEAEIILLDQSSAETDTISNEVKEEDDEHLFCFDVSAADVTISRTDSDGTYEVGLDSDWTTGSASSGQVTISLKHQPEVKDGSCTVGETDIELTFQLKIE